MGRTANIRDVAREANVGLGTVSRVLNNHPSVSEETRKRVQAAIGRLRYRPSAQARRLVKGATDTVCFILSNREFMQTFHARFLQGVQRFISATGYQVIYTPVSYSPHTPPSAISLPRIIGLRDAVDGVIVAGTNYPNFLQALDQLGMPYVLFANNLVGEVSGPRMDMVSFDDEGGAYAAARRLAELGHRHVWFLGDTSLPWFGRRFSGYLRAMRDFDAPARWITDLKADDSVHFGYLAIKQALASGTVTAVVAGNDHIAYGVWKALRELGLPVPDAVSLVGFDDTELCELADPPLASISVHNEEVGAECARLLLERLRNPGVRYPEALLPVELVERGSIGPPARAGRVAV